MIMARKEFGDSYLDYLGEIFVKEKVSETYNIDFDAFVEFNRQGSWERWSQSYLRNK